MMKNSKGHIRSQHPTNFVSIGKDVWLGSNAFICENTTIGDGAVVGANAVVTHDVSPGSIVAGVPARLI
jgi:acetyltransferase-like isoleucine patch superfamily enzyme